MDIISEVDELFQGYTQDLVMSSREIDRLRTENDRLRQLCGAVQDEVTRYERICGDWRDFGQYASKMLSEEVLRYKYRLTELEARQADLFEENLRLQRIVTSREGESEKWINRSISADAQCWNCGVSVAGSAPQDQPTDALLPLIERKSKLGKLRESLRLKPRKGRPASAMVASPVSPTANTPMETAGNESRTFHRSNSLPSLSKKWTPPKAVNSSFREPWAPSEASYAPTIDVDRTPTQELPYDVMSRDTELRWTPSEQLSLPHADIGGQENTLGIQRDPLYGQVLVERGQPFWGVAASRKEQPYDQKINRGPLRPTNLPIEGGPQFGDPNNRVTPDPLHGTKTKPVLNSNQKDHHSPNSNFWAPLSQSTASQGSQLPITPDPLYGPKKPSAPAGGGPTPDPLYGAPKPDPLYSGGVPKPDPLYGAPKPDPLYSGGVPKTDPLYGGNMERVSLAGRPLNQETPSPVVVHMWNTSPSRSEGRMEREGSSTDSADLSARTNASVHTLV